MINTDDLLKYKVNPEDSLEKITKNLNYLFEVDILSLDKKEVMKLKTILSDYKKPLGKYFKSGGKDLNQKRLLFLKQINELLV